MKIKTIRPLKRLYITTILTIALLLPTITFSSHASLPSLDQIRVALFIDARGVVPAVTLSSSANLHIGTRQSDGVIHWLTHAKDTPLRASLDQYRILVMETTDMHAANVLAEQVNGLVGASYVMRVSQRGQPTYRVYIGPFASEDRARSELGRIVNLAQMMPFDPIVTGPLHINAGTYYNKEAALAQQSVINDHGLNARLVYHEDEAAELVYSIWLGEAVNQQQLNMVMEEASAVLRGIHLQVADTTKPYIIVQEELSTAGTIWPHYYINATDHAVWISGDEPIRIAERSNRTYRGNIELRQYKGSMAVINELPFEHYLYSVVGSEVNSSWPIESLKAQAVVARTFALAQGMKYGIAHVSDTTYEQAYYGIQSEYAAAIAAVEATAGQIIVDQHGLIEAFYYSNAGGMTAHTSEIWQTPLDYITVKPSPDQIAADGKLIWYRVVLPGGTIGYVRSDYADDSGERNAAGYPILIANASNINVRPAPFVNNSTNGAIATINVGDQLILFEETLESNAYRWVQGPFTAQQIQRSISRASSIGLTDELLTLEVAQRGPSGRVIEMLANGQQITVSTPDSFRLAMNGLQSTRFDVEEMGRYTILGAHERYELPNSEGKSLYILSGDQNSTNTRPVEATSSALFVLNGLDDTRLITQEPQFRFIGLGFGHGIGLSQWGARELAEFLGYDYKEIIDYYYSGVSIVKD